MKKKSNITGLWYETKEMVSIRNPKQAAKYIKGGCTLFDLIVDDKFTIVYLFDREESKYYFARWVDGTL